MLALPPGRMVCGESRATILNPEKFRALGNSADKRVLPGCLYVGLTGGIGSGKTTVARSWSEQGAVIIDADALAREVLEPGSKGLAQVVRLFGEHLVLENDSLNRELLSHLVFTDMEAKNALENITHPLIAKRAAELALEARPGSVVVYDVPLLIELELDSQFDLVTVVDAPLPTRLTRLEGRGLGQEEALRRASSQASDQQRRQVADLWIDNVGGVSDTAALAEQVYWRWLDPLVLDTQIAAD